MIYIITGNVYDGEWKDNKFVDGKVDINFPNGDKYMGQIAHDQANG